MVLRLRITSVELSERDFRDVEKSLAELPDGSTIEWIMKKQAGARRLSRPGGRRFGRWTDDREVGALGSVLYARARFDVEVEDGRSSYH